MMWTIGWRDQVWSNLNQRWDLIIIGGGITGAGILREATRAGFKALLVEAEDFASGTSSRSSKLVHGGLRYLRNAQLKLTYNSVWERERLIQEGRGLIIPMSFLMTCFSSDPLPSWTFGIGLIIYDLLALKWEHRYYDSKGIRALCPILSETNLRGGYRYIDAQTDDARLVLRILREACREGGTALNYARVEGFCRTHSGQICGVVLRDTASPKSNRTIELSSPLVINATGAWADILRAKSLPLGKHALKHHLRRLRGSHLVFPSVKLPLNRAISFCHPQDGRPVFAFPWLGVTIVGTTDIDHEDQELSNPFIRPQEVDYLMSAVNHAFPILHLEEGDIQCTYSGIRAVLDTGKSNPSKESREHIIWFENGLLTVAGGKLTTFRLTAHDALRKVRRFLPNERQYSIRSRMLDKTNIEMLQKVALDPSIKMNLLGKYGIEALEMTNMGNPDDLEPFASSNILWGELRWVCRNEGVVHLDDLLLRRVRLGLLLPNGGVSLLNRIRTIVQTELKWDDHKWSEEAHNYQQLWQKAHSPHPK